MRVAATLLILAFAAFVLWFIWRDAAKVEAETLTKLRTELRTKPEPVTDDVAPPRPPKDPDLYLESTAYCLNDRPMANGRMPHEGAAAKNFDEFGTKYLITTGPLAGKVVQITDRHKPGSTQLDIWLPDCEAAKRYGRQTVGVVRL